MPEKLVVHFVLIHRHKKSGKYMTKDYTLTGEDVLDRMKDIVTIQANSWAEEWELVTFSHSFMPSD